MKIIVPMAGRGSRLRPHTLTVPKPLVPIAGKPIVQRLVEDLAAVYEGSIEEITFIIGDFGKQVEEDLLDVANRLGTKGKICHQDQPLGTAHAILCAGDSLSGPCLVAFADTLFRTDFKLDTNKDGIVWVKRVENPSAYGVVELNDEQFITNFVEKPAHFVSDLAIIGIYYFKDGAYLRSELQYLIDNDIKERGEYQLTNALENMRRKGSQFFTGEILEWLDCGNKDAVVYSNQRILELNKGSKLIDDSAQLVNTIVHEPCYIGANATINNAVIGPYVSIGQGTTIDQSIIENTVIQNHTSIRNAILKDSMIGNHVDYSQKKSEISIGDYCKLSD